MAAYSIGLYDGASLFRVFISVSVIEIIGSRFILIWMVVFCSQLATDNPQLNIND